MKLRRALTVLMLLFATSATAGQDPFVGRWVLDASRSEYPEGSCPKNMTVEMEAVGQGVHYRSDSTFADGQTTHSEYTAQ